MRAIRNAIIFLTLVSFLGLTGCATAKVLYKQAAGEKLTKEDVKEYESEMQGLRTASQGILMK